MLFRDSIYDVNEEGIVTNILTAKVIKQWSGKNNKYKLVDIWINQKKNRFLIHRMVAELYVPNPDKKPHVNHIDGNPLNNHYSNLEWVTPRENRNHAINELNQSMTRNFTTCSLYENEEKVKDFDCILDACKYANKMFGAKLHSIRKHRKWRTLQIRCND